MTAPLRMSFGKYRGVLFAEIPTEYLLWLSGRSDLWTDLRTAVTSELRERLEFERARDEATRQAAQARNVPPPIDVVMLAHLELFTDEGYYRLALRCHPDAGGSHEAMVALNAMRAAIRAWLDDQHRRQP